MPLMQPASYVPHNREVGSSSLPRTTSKYKGLCRLVTRHCNPSISSIVTFSLPECSGTSVFGGVS